MRRLTPIVCCVLSLLLGLSLGWRIGHASLSPQQRELLEDYQQAKATFGMSESDMLKLQAYLPQLRRDMERTDEFAAGIALSALYNMERGEAEQAKEQLRATVSIYWRSHQTDGLTNMLLKIQQYAATNLALSNALHKKLE
jgi:hypothetical protein